MNLYGRAIRKLIPVESCRVAEAVKLTENIFRSVNIAMVNELKMVFAAMGIDVWDVIAAAKTKPLASCRFIPAPASADIAFRLIHFISRGRRGNSDRKRNSLSWPVKSTRQCPLTSSGA